MAARQLWAFLTKTDLGQLLAELERRDPGLVVSPGRYLRGEARLLLTAPETLERRESLPGEQRLYLFHRKHSAALVVHPQPEGPFAGWSQIDEERSDCLVVRLGDAPPGDLTPARIYCYVNFWRAADKERKRPVFSIWASQSLKWLSSQLPPSGVEFVRIGPEALAKAKAGALRLTYLYREIAPEPREL